jgi:hypothetical protein
VTAAARGLAAPRWGQLIDEVGAKPVLIFCSFAITILPLLWVTATRDSMWLIWCDPLLSGILWGGHAQAIFQLPLTVAPRRERSYYLAAFAMAGGLAFAFATSLAGALASRITSGVYAGGHHLVNYQVLFLLSALARGAAATLSLRLVEKGGQPVEALWARLAPRLRVPAGLVPGNNRSI